MQASAAKQVSTATYLHKELGLLGEANKKKYHSIRKKVMFCYEDILTYTQSFTSHHPAKKSRAVKETVDNITE